VWDLLFDDSYGIEETGRAKRGKKHAGGMFFRSGEIPLTFGRSLVLWTEKRNQFLPSQQHAPPIWVVLFFALRESKGR
jgi:hypothetical protein